MTTGAILRRRHSLRRTTGASVRGNLGDVRSFSVKEPVIPNIAFDHVTAGHINPALWPGTWTVCDELETPAVPAIERRPPNLQLGRVLQIGPGRRDPHITPAHHDFLSEPDHCVARLRWIVGGQPLNSNPVILRM